MKIQEEKHLKCVRPSKHHVIRVGRLDIIWSKLGSSGERFEHCQLTCSPWIIFSSGPEALFYNGVFITRLLLNHHT